MIIPISLQELVPVLQIAIIPVILISGVSLFLLTLTNRFGRVTDRVRCLAVEARGTTPADKDRIQPQITALFRRARYLRAAVTFPSFCVLLNVGLVIVLFVAAFFNIELALLVSVVFMASRLALATSTITFLLDLHFSLLAWQRKSSIHKALMQLSLFAISSRKAIEGTDRDSDNQNKLCHDPRLFPRGSEKNLGAGSTYGDLAVS